MDRKGFDKSVLTIAMVLLCLNARAQQNLVPNPSFEEHTDCPSSPGKIFMATGWVSVKGSIDYFQLCGTNGYGMPENAIGNQHAYDGSSYIGIAPWAFGLSNAREYAGVQLDNSLIEGHRYIFNMVVSMADTVSYATRNFGVLFTTSQPPNNLPGLFSSSPQVVYDDTAYLSDQEGWMQVDGFFVAEGGEEFMTIGNFDDDSEVDTLFVVDQPAKTAYYYIDDVSVVEDTSYHVGIASPIGNEQLSIYPNPTADVLTVEATGKDMAFELLDVRGKAILRQLLQSSRQPIDVSQLPTGVYVAVLRQKGVAVAREKVVVQR